MVGQGVDRHLFGLYLVMRGFKWAKDDDFISQAIRIPWTLSTSQSPQNQVPPSFSNPPTLKSFETLAALSKMLTLGMMGYADPGPLGPQRKGRQDDLAGSVRSLAWREPALVCTCGHVGSEAAAALGSEGSRD
eukprot:3913415-Rhodomonas_salina.4